MKKDIVFPKVEGVSVAVVRKMNEIQQAEWFVYLLNANNHELESVFVTSRGYGEIGGEQRQTSMLRHALGTVAENAAILIEPIDASVFQLFNEYWVSYYIGNEIYDKKYVFVPDSIVESNLVKIEQLNLMGIVHD
jgi:hypothetical protein